MSHRTKQMCVFNFVFAGRRKLVQCLLSVRQIFNLTEHHYILNDLYVTDYCVWVQHCSSCLIQSLAKELDKVVF